MSSILVIDDDEEIRTLLTQTLSAAGHTISQASDGMDGMKLCQQTPPDLVITDLWMPNREGLETVMALRKDSPKSKIIVMSGRPSTGKINYFDLVKRLGASDTLVKPFTREELLETVSGVLENSSAKNRPETLAI